jgi:hypothetical protein
MPRHRHHVARTVALSLACATTIVTAAAGQPAPAPYAFPFKGEDQAPTERYETTVHQPGIQALGKDIVMQRHLLGTTWSEFLQAPQVGNKRHLIYGRPFYAMADGVVVGCWRNAPENSVVGLPHPMLAIGRFAGGGNHLWIQQDDGNVALYAHAFTGSIPAALCPHTSELFTGKSGRGGSPDIEPEAMVPAGSRARVRRGQFLGSVGNSGASSKPHLHVHMERSGAAVPMVFERGLATRFLPAPLGETTTSIDGPWARFAGQQLPAMRILVWPARTLGGQLTFNGTPASEYQRLFDHLADSGFMPSIVSCVVDGATLRYNAVWVPSSGVWMNHLSTSSAEYTSEHGAAVSAGFVQTSFDMCNTAAGPRYVAVYRK